MSHEVITKADDPAAQRHEKIGTERIYNNLLTHQDGPIHVALHAHDRNMSINKLVREEFPYTRNQNDVWHTTKALEKEIIQISKGPKYKHGQTWHEQLSDKTAAIRTHANYVIRASQGDAQVIRTGMDNIPNHYMNNHIQCLPLSRCKIDPNYIPSKIIITDPRGGTLDIYWWGCAAAHPKRGVLGTGTTQKRGVLGTGTTQKRGVLGTGTTQKRGVLGTGTSRKRGKKYNLSN